MICDCWCADFSDFFFFKQKTAYEMRISDWSSRVLFRSPAAPAAGGGAGPGGDEPLSFPDGGDGLSRLADLAGVPGARHHPDPGRAGRAAHQDRKSVV